MGSDQRDLEKKKRDSGQLDYLLFYFFSFHSRNKFRLVIFRLDLGMVSNTRYAWAQFAELHREITGRAGPPTQSKLNPTDPKTPDITSRPHPPTSHGEQIRNSDSHIVRHRC